MSSFFWNIRGFNKSSKQRVIKDWLKSNSMQFGCLLETRVKETRAMRLANSVFKDWSMVSNYEFHRLGRIWVVWSQEVKLTVVFKSGQMITCLIAWEDFDFCISFIDASNFSEERKTLWKVLL